MKNFGALVAFMFLGCILFGIASWILLGESSDAFRIVGVVFGLGYGLWVTYDD